MAVLKRCFSEQEERMPREVASKDKREANSIEEKSLFFTINNYANS